MVESAWLLQPAADENWGSNFGLGKSGEISSTLSQKNHLHLIHQTIQSNIWRKNHESTGDAYAGHAAPFQSSLTSPGSLFSTPAFTLTHLGPSWHFHILFCLNFYLFPSCRHIRWERLKESWLVKNKSLQLSKGPLTTALISKAKAAISSFVPLINPASTNTRPALGN